MPAARWVPPLIMFIDEEPAAGMAAKFAYFVRIGGQPWAYADLLEVHKKPEDAKAFRLDPGCIVEATNPQTGEPCFAYQGLPGRS
jgi:hypothetical protein